MRVCLFGGIIVCYTALFGAFGVICAEESIFKTVISTAFRWAMPCTKSELRFRQYNPLLAITYLLGAGVKSIKDKAQHAYNKRTERKELVSAIQYLSSDEEERKQRDKIMARRQKCAAVCLISEL